MAGNLQAGSTSDATKTLEIKDLVHIWNGARSHYCEAKYELTGAEADIVKWLVRNNHSECLKVKWDSLRGLLY